MSQKDTTKTSNEDTALPEDAAETPIDSEDTSTQAPTDTAEPAAEDKQTAQEQQAKEYLEGWQRERSEFANYKKRVEREMKDLTANAAAQAFMSLLPIIDDFERAFATLPEELQGNAWTEGITGIHRKFQKILDDQGITIIDPVGETFDPNQHEAVGTEDSDTVKSGHVTTTLQKGYRRGERVLRPALVRVAS